MNYSLKDFSYTLPPELIAQQPTKRRDQARLLVLNKTIGTIEHKRFSQVIDFLRAGDVLVLNNSKVFPARLLGRKVGTGGAVEIFLHRQVSSFSWECLLGGRVSPGLEIEVSNKLRAKILQNNENGTWLIDFNLSGNSFFQEINRIGLVPLPPYIKRSEASSVDKAKDKRFYQTVFADKEKVGSVAAPTAGLHFTHQLLARIRAKGVKIMFVTLHVGLGTFASIKTANILDHKMHSELAEISRRTWREIARAKSAGKRVIAVGTTSCRALEAAACRPEFSFILKKGHEIKADKSHKTLKTSFWADIFIYPGYKFKIIDGLITNFHLPESTLLMLVSALAGKKNIQHAYQTAIKERYRFFSYGDAMLIQ